MANYLSIANELVEKNTNLYSDYSNINSLLSSLKGAMIGESSTKLSNDLANCVAKLKSQIDYFESLTNVLKLINNHEEDVNTLEYYKNKKSNWSSLDPKETNPYTSKVSTWERNVSSNETKINNNLPSITSTTKSITLVTPNVDYSYKNYIDAASTIISQVASGFDVSFCTSYQELLGEAINDWLGTYKNYEANNIKLGVLGDYYTEDYIDNIIATRSTGANPREKAVIAALTVLDLGLEKGIRSKYQLSTEFFNSVSRPYDTEAMMDHGFDCASYVSYALNKASSNGFNNASLNTLQKLGVKTSYDQLQPGDIIHHDGHVAMIIGNSPDDGYVIVADAAHLETGGYPSGVRLQKIKYANLKSNNFVGYDMTRFYGA